jgi:hypothetical protein
VAAAAGRVDGGIGGEHRLHGVVEHLGS